MTGYCCSSQGDVTDREEIKRIVADENKGRRPTAYMAAAFREVPELFPDAAGNRRPGSRIIATVQWSFLQCSKTPFDVIMGAGQSPPPATALRRLRSVFVREKKI